MRVTPATSVERSLLTRVIWNVILSTCVQTALAERGNVRTVEKPFSIRATYAVTYAVIQVFDWKSISNKSF